MYQSAPLDQRNSCLRITPLSSDLSPRSELPSSQSSTFEVGQRIESVFRYGAHYECTSKHGNPAWMIDLYQRNAVLTGFAEEWTIDKFPLADVLVRIEGVVIHEGEVPCIWVRSFEVLEMLPAEYCIFDTALPHWVTDKNVVDRACRLWASLPDEDRLFLNAVFLEPRVLRGFLRAPGSCRHHHAHEGGCIEHSVESAELADVLAASAHHLDRDLLVTAALIHDAGKSIEYVRSQSGEWQMSRYGRRVGHKVSGIQLATIAMVRCPTMSRRRKESYTHMLACSHAPAWAGFRRPDSPEAAALAGLDRSSAEAGLITPRH